MNSFIFTPPPVSCAIQAEIPIGITNTKELLLALYNTLKFPDYFGMNWDALDECLGDLSWLPAGHVHLLHRDMPLRNDRKEMCIYLASLDHAIKKWNTEGSNLIFICPENRNPNLDELIVHRKLFISFPVEYKALITSTLGF